MAKFDIALKETLKHEGGYANQKHDHGGETYKGISRNNWRGWDGWAQVDRIKAKVEAEGKAGDLNLNLNLNPDLQGRVREFYHRNFWMPVMEEIENQELANWLFDKGVNMGIRQAYKLMQRALHVDQDGIIGPQTRAMIKQTDPVQLLADCREEAKKFYTRLALKDPTQQRFLKGWLARA